MLQNILRSGFFRGDELRVFRVKTFRSKRGAKNAGHKKSKLIRPLPPFLSIFKTVSHPAVNVFNYVAEIFTGVVVNFLHFGTIYLDLKVFVCSIETLFLLPVPIEI